MGVSREKLKILGIRILEEIISSYKIWDLNEKKNFE